MTVFLFQAGALGLVVMADRNYNFRGVVGAVTSTTSLFFANITPRLNLEHAPLQWGYYGM